MSCSRRRFLAGAGVLAVGGLSIPLGLAQRESRAGVRLGMVHDETRCIGCTACMDACRTVNQVPESVSRLEIIRSGPTGAFPEARYRFFRHSCQHCDRAPCVAVCPTGASYRDMATGIVDVHADLCVGCQYCIVACPYQVRFIHPETRVADKCDFCRKTRLRQGLQPACVEACPTKALIFGDLEDPHSDIARLIAGRITYRYKPALGTLPKLYRVPFRYGEVKL